MAALGRLPCFNLQVMAGGNPGIYGAGQRPAQAQRRGPASVVVPALSVTRSTTYFLLTSSPFRRAFLHAG